MDAPGPGQARVRPLAPDVVLVNPLIYINDGMRAAFTDVAHMHLYIIYPVIVAFCVVFLRSDCATSAARSWPDHKTTSTSFMLVRAG